MKPMIKPNNIIINRKWISLVVFLVFMALSAETIEYVKISERVSPTFFETILVQTNDPQMILFPLMYVFLLFTMYEKIEIGTKKSPIKLFKSAIFSAAFYIIFFITANLLYCVFALNIHFVFNNIWSYVGELSDTQLSPLMATSVSLLLLFMRLSFLSYLISFINALTRKKHWGFWSAFIISYIDFWIYDMLYIEYPLGILPLEHTRIVYTEALTPDFENTAMRIPYLTSILYWLGLLAIIYFAFVSVYKKRRRNGV